MTEPRHQRIARHLRGRAAELRVKNVELASATGLSVATISRKLSGQVPLSIDEVDVIARSLGTSWAEISMATGDEPAPSQVVTERDELLRVLLPGGHSHLPPYLARKAEGWLREAQEREAREQEAGE